MTYRIEKDSLGEVKVPGDKYWGAQTQRSLENFEIGNQLMPFGIIEAMAIVKKACAEVNNQLTLLDEEKKRLISQVCDEIIQGKLNEHFPLVIWQTGSGTQTNMNVNEVIANRSKVLAGHNLNDSITVVHPNDDANKSQSSNDTFPTAMNIALYSVLYHNTIPGIERLLDSFRKKKKEFEPIVKIGRTHLMDATPITLGQEFSGYISQLEHGLECLKKTLPHLAELAIGGTAVGTGLNAPAGFDQKVCATIATYTGLPFIAAPNKYEALSSNDAIVECSSAMKVIAVSLMKIANDIRLSGSGPRCGIGELMLPANEPGSSIMPGKINPTQTESITMICAQVCGNDAAIGIGGMNGHFQLNVFKPVMIKNALESAQLLGDGCNSFAKNCIDGLQANTVQIKKNLDQSLMLVTALNTRIGYEKAAKIALKAYNENTTLKEAAVSLGFVCPEDFDCWVEPKKMTNS